MDRSGTGGVHDLLVERSHLAPQRTAFVVVGPDGTDASVSYARFAQDVERHAVALHDAGVARGDSVLLHLGTSLDFLRCWFACLRLGAIAVPTNLASPTPEIAHVIDVTGATHVVTEPAYREVIDAIGRDNNIELSTRIMARTADPVPGWLNLGERVADIAPDAALPWPAPGASEPAEVLFTSGTTSKPRGALLTHANLIRAGNRVSLHYSLTDDDRVFTVLPLFHTGGQCMGIMAALAVGATCVLVERYSATAFWDQIRRHGGTFVMLVATHVTTLLAQPPDRRDRDHPLQRTAFGLMITDAERDAFESRHGVRLTYCYGQTEACLLIAIAPLFGPRRWPAMGLPAFDRVVRVGREDGTEASPGEVGEILVRCEPGRDVMREYVNDPAATAATLVDGWLHTGDNGYFDEAGYLHFVDRKKDMIKRAGENVSALEVEAVLNAHPGIVEAAVIGVPDEVRGEAVKAFVVLAPGVEPSPEEIREHCTQWLASFKIPTQLEIVGALPKTAIGKISKKALRTL